MKSLTVKSAVLAAAITVAAPATFAASANGTASATVVSAISIAAGVPMNFGQFTVGASGGTISTAGAVTGDVLTAGGSRQHGAFDVTGNSGQNYNISLPSPTVTLSSPGHPDMSAALSAPASPRTLTGGADSFVVGGVLTVGANQPAGSYSGTYAVDVNY